MNSLKVYIFLLFTDSETISFNFLRDSGARPKGIDRSNNCLSIGKIMSCSKLLGVAE
jgi:hypothetical protein